MMGRLPSLLQAKSDGRGQEESGCAGRGAAGGRGDAFPDNSNQRSAAAGTFGEGGYGEGLYRLGETAIGSRGAGGALFSGGETAGQTLFSGGGGISKFSASQVETPVFKGGAAQYPGWKADFAIKVGMLGVSDVFYGSDLLPDVRKPPAALSSEGFTPAAIRQTYLAWNFLSSALPTEKYDRAESMFKTDPGWEKLTDEEKEEKIQGFLTEAFGRAGSVANTER